MPPPLVQVEKAKSKYALMEMQILSKYIWSLTHWTK